MTSTISIRGRSPLAAAVTVLLVVSAVAVGVSLVAAGTASAAPTGISDCTVVDEPGTYELTSNVSPNDPADDGPCIAVRADDVSLDGNGHAVDLGDANGSGIVVGASGAAAVANVTVRDVTVRAGDGATGVAYRNVTGGVVANVTAEAGRPLRVDGGEEVTVRDSAFTSDDAAALRVTADDATVVGNDVRVTSTTNRKEDDSIGGLSVGGSNGTVRGNAVDVSLEAAYDDYGVRVGGSNYTAVDNEVTGEAAVGIVVGGSDNVVSSNNVSEEIVMGVAVGGSDNTFSDTYTTNTVLVNGTGALVEDVAIVHAYNGVQVEGSDNAFVNVTLVDLNEDAMYIRGSNNTVTDLTVSDSWDGVSVRGSNNTVSDSTVEQVYAVGISATGSNNTLSDNTASNNGDGMSVSGSNNTLSDNTASENRESGFSIDGSNNILSDNTASENRRFGFHIDGSNNTVVGNDATSTRDVGFSVRGSNTTVVGNDASDNNRGIVVYEDGHTVRSNRIHNATEVGVFVQGNRTLVYDNLVETAAGGEPVVGADRSAIVVGRGPGQGRTVGMRVYHSNVWNVTARSGENVVGGSTTGGNYYAVVNGTGFSEACRDADRNGVCDDPNALSPNDTDHLPLADDTNASVGYLEVTDVDAPPRFERGEAETVTANVTNVGTETVTQSITVTSSDRYATVESSPVRRTVTLVPGETTTVTFDVVVNSNTDQFLSLVPVSVSSANASLTARVRVVESQPSFYQVDFVAGDPIENLSVVNLYAQDDRLFQYAFGEADEGITSRGSAWENETLRECVDHGAITDNGNGTASVTFTVGENCSSRAFSLAVYSLPGAEFSLSTVDQQELLNATTETYGPGEHTITVDLPDENDGDD